MTDNGPQSTFSDGPEPKAHERQSIGELIASITNQFSRLLQAEVDSFKTEIKTKATKSALAIGLFAVAGVLSLYGLGFLFWAAITGIATALPLWLSALIVAVAIFIIATVLALVGKKTLAKHTPPAPTETIASIKQDVAAIKDGIK